MQKLAFGAAARWRRRSLILMLALAMLSTAAAQGSHKHHKTEKNKNKDVPILWMDPGNIAARDLYYGPGGKEHEPQGPMKFLKEDMAGSNPKFDLEDGKGEKWKAKLGVEAQPETAAVRLLWAVGYFADEDYFVPRLQVDQMPELRRGGKAAGPDGLVHNVRLKYRPEKKEGNWRWDDNPFVDTRELNGLRVMMALLNNWDLKTENNAIYRDKNTGRETYLVTDVGASFGTTGYHYYGGWSKNDLEAYTESRFISHAGTDYVDFATPSHPPFLYFIGVPRFVRYFHQRGITRHIPRKDAKWIGGLLAQLTETQIRDAFRAAGYTPAQIDILAGVVRDRIALLKGL
ncbi:MAG: hypothetical protein JO041_10645 [Acidobacteria bacterium]|nr:hypothetical protein [Acidobacteriota bacterium]